MFEPKGIQLLTATKLQPTYDITQLHYTTSPPCSNHQINNELLECKDPNGNRMVVRDPTTGPCGWLT